MPAPKGNKNALTHGLYATRRKADLTPEEGKEFAALDLRPELLYLRFIARRMEWKLERAFSGNGYLSDKALDNLKAYLEIADRIINAVKTQAFLTGDVSEIEKLIEDGKFLTRDKLLIANYFDPPAQDDPQPDQGCP